MDDRNLFRGEFRRDMYPGVSTIPVMKMVPALITRMVGREVGGTTTTTLYPCDPPSPLCISDSFFACFYDVKFCRGSTGMDGGGRAGTFGGVDGF
jgi:hypothetical protein